MILPSFSPPREMSFIPKRMWAATPSSVAAHISPARPRGNHSVTGVTFVAMYGTCVAVSTLMSTVASQPGMRHL